MSFPEATAQDHVDVVVDAYALQEPPALDDPDVSPVPGYTLGVGPDAEALQYRLVTCPTRMQSGILPGGTTNTCCT
jgi:hypothetical protein